MTYLLYFRCDSGDILNFFLRRKLTIVLALIALVLLACVWYLYAGLDGKKNPNQENTLALAVREYVVDRDTDGDGLMDWEEDLWRTDKSNKDTDGDGTSDDDEVRAGRNPTVPGPDDALSRAAANPSTAAGERELTTTDRLARNIFAEYYALKQEGTLDEAAQEELILRNLSGVLPEGSSVPTYGIGDVLMSGEGSAALRTYGNTVGRIVATHSIQTENEGTIVQRALETDNGEELKKLEPVVVAYRAMAQELLGTKVPKEAAAAHISLVNAITAVGEANAKLTRVLVDPIVGLVGIREYGQAVEDLGNALKKLRSVFGAYGITFTPEEAGGYLQKTLSQI